jgi:hypothetical protein
MNAIFKPVAYGLAAYLVSAVGLWFVLLFVLLPVMPATTWLLPAVITLIPLFLSGYVTAKVAVSSHRSRRVVLGGVAGIIGFGISLVITQAQGEAWPFILLAIGGAAVAASGGFLGSQKQNLP